MTAKDKLYAIEIYIKFFEKLKCPLPKKVAYDHIKKLLKGERK